MISIPKYIAPLNKITWKPVKSGDSRLVFEKINLKHLALGDLTIGITDVSKKFGSGKQYLEIIDKQKNTIGAELFSINPNTKSMYGFDIHVDQDLQRKGFRLGEILRAFSVLEMLKNNIQTFEIYSKETAVYFHSKYKFKPCEIRTDFCKKMLQSIKQNNIKDFSIRASEILNDFSQAKTQIEQINACKRTNDLTEKYIEKVLTKKEPQNKHSFIDGFKMKLTNETILQNKEFYNRLFKNHGIDYKI